MGGSGGLGGGGGRWSVILSACTWLKRDLRAAAGAVEADGGGGANCDGGSGGATDLRARDRGRVRLG